MESFFNKYKRQVTEWPIVCVHSDALCHTALIEYMYSWLIEQSIQGGYTDFKERRCKNENAHVSNLRKSMGSKVQETLFLVIGDLYLWPWPLWPWPLNKDVQHKCWIQHHLTLVYKHFPSAPSYSILCGEIFQWILTARSIWENSCIGHWVYGQGYFIYTAAGY